MYKLEGQLESSLIIKGLVVFQDNLCICTLKERTEEY